MSFQSAAEDQKIGARKYNQTEPSQLNRWLFCVCNLCGIIGLNKAWNKATMATEKKSKKANKTTLKAGDNLPPRGMSNKNRIIEAMKAESFEGLGETSTRDECEIAFFRKVIKKASDAEDKDSGAMITLLGNKGWSNMKPTLGNVEFDFDAKATPSQQASQVMEAAAKGELAPDIANMFVSSIASMLKIEEVTALRDEVDEIKAILKAQANG